MHAPNEEEDGGGDGEPRAQLPPLPPRGLPSWVPGNDRLRAVRDRLAEMEQVLGPAEYDEGFEAGRERRNRRTHHPRGLMAGRGPSAFASGSIRKRGSRLRTERAELLAQLRNMFRLRDDARDRGFDVPDEGERPHNPNQNYRFDRGPGGGGGMGEARGVAA